MISWRRIRLFIRSHVDEFVANHIPWGRTISQIDEQELEDMTTATNNELRGRVQEGDVIMTPAGEAEKRYVVLDARLAGGGTGHGPNDVYPDGWQVKARLLKDDGTYDPAGATISFYQTGQAGSHCYSDNKPAAIVGTMTKIFV
jgi:hypothetical protein